MNSSIAPTQDVHPVTRWLQSKGTGVFSAYTVFAAFSAYFCMYAFRKPFAVGTFEGQVNFADWLVVDYKIALIIFQVFGYTLSKFTGIKVISELKANQRAMGLVIMIATAEIALVLFGIVPKPWNLIFLFLNGVPLGMVWGLVFSYLEGRRLTELLGAGLSASYIVASGYVKAVGRWLLNEGVSEFWMPCLTGLIFFVPFMICVWLLDKLPPPTPEDEALRTKRVPMDHQERSRFVKLYFPGLFALVGLYIFLTAYRDFRDNFAREIWDALGFSETPAIFAESETWVGLAVMLSLGLLFTIKDNRKALIAVHAVMFVGVASVGITTLLFRMGLMDAKVWMIVIGIGLYLAYVPYGCILFDRLIAVLGFSGNAGFMIYVADSFGYLGSVGIMLYKNFGEPELSWLDFFIPFSYFAAIVCSVSFVFSSLYFLKLAPPEKFQAASQGAS
ncbi:MAG: DUF5690 family protein [Myxococcota bacterium]|nr:DUF5690 family protein [Myxococcota bacterium]